MTNYPIPENAAQALLMRLKYVGVDYLFGNAGTDFAPVIEAFANNPLQNLPMPEPLVMPHETAAIAMAHGYYLATGRAQAAMVHVNVGLANSVMGLINAKSDNVPLIMMAGRTPLTEHDRLGSRMTPIQYGQEMFDQAGLVREATKWNYELRYPETAADLADRAYAVANASPRGPVYLELPREPLAEAWPGDKPVDFPRQSTPTLPAPDAAAIEQAAEWLAGAKSPLVITQRSDPEKRLGGVLDGFVSDYALPVVQHFAIQNTLAAAHPMNCGYDFGDRLETADVILAIDAEVPWIQRNHQPNENCKVIHVGPDPIFSRMPVRSYKNDLAIVSDPAAAVTALAAAMGADGGASGRFDEIKAANEKRRAAMTERALQGNGAPMSPPFVAHCVSEYLDGEAMIFTELGPPPPFLDAKGPHQVFLPPNSGGLGWGVPAALGASLANPNRLSIAAVGDGSYIFSNPVACHQIAEAMELPILIIIMNNGIWNAVRRAARNVYPDGQADKLNVMPLTSLRPSPDFCQVAEASRGYAEKVERGEDLPAALARAVEVIRTEKRHALLELMVSVPN